MLTLKNIKKIYKTGDITQVALNDISINFRKNEFVAILGPSGSGKTTCLNVIGGLDKYDSGDLIINGKSTKEFNDTDWDAYRNNSIGFVFQGYNLIKHLDIVSNVEIGMTLSGVSSQEKRKRALEVLEKVGLKDHVNKNPHELSGGQMQRVAIARALVNNPDIILADEPTGALDTKTSIQIMDLIKEISKEKLVIMVTHNSTLANKYADRIVEFEDGKIIGDSNKLNEELSDGSYSLNKTSMDFISALKLSFKNVKTKKGRTLLTAFASSIGIIGLALVLGVTSGFKKSLDKPEVDVETSNPIVINQINKQLSLKFDKSDMEDFTLDDSSNKEKEGISLYDSNTATDASYEIHKNNFNNNFMNYINNIDKNIASAIGHTRNLNLNVIRKVDNTYKKVQFSKQSYDPNLTYSTMSSYPNMLDKGSDSYLKKNFNLVAGEYPTKDTDLVLILNHKKQLDVNILKDLGMDIKNTNNKIDYKDLVGMEFKIVNNNDFYEKTDRGIFVPTQDFKKAYDSQNNITVTIKGVLSEKDNALAGLNLLTYGVAYNDNLVNLVLNNNKDSEIVKAQKDVNYNIFTKQNINQDTKDSLLTYLGGSDTPQGIIIFPTEPKKKKEIINYLDKYNSNVKSKEDKIIYDNPSKDVIYNVSQLMDSFSKIFIVFSIIILIVSVIMMGIITYISVLERTKEIGILRALGARKVDISRVFNAETFIVGSLSGIIGILISYILIFPVNMILEKMTEVKNIASLNPLHAVLLIVLSIVITVLGGWIPAKVSASKNPVEALRD